MSRLSHPLFTALFVLFVAVLVAAQGLAPAPAQQAPAGPDRAVPPREVYRPLAVPDRIILTWKGDPATSQAVTWRTDTTVTHPQAQIALADAGPYLARSANLRLAASQDLTTNLGPARYHSVHFEGLQPDTRYAYRVGDAANWSEWFHFRTASSHPEPFAFIYFGDAQNDIKSLWSRVIREAYSDAPKARFIVHAGDLVNTANSDSEWGEWFGGGGWVNGMVPSVPSPGNHEYGGGRVTADRQLSAHWRPQFTLPDDGPPGLEETVYSLDYQGLRLISLNSNQRQPEQVAWLEDRLRDNPNRWTVVTFHHPIFAAARSRDNPELRRLWEPVLRRHRVDLVLQGHDHSYARSNLQTGMNARDPKNGTVYVVSVSGPKMFNLDREPWMKRAAEDTQLYQVIAIDGDRLRYEARTAVGDLYDAFDLEKRPGRVNRMLDRVPELPERRKPPTQQVAPPRAPAAPPARG